MAFLKILILSASIFLILLSCSKSKLPPDVNSKVQKMNKEIMELENDLKFMVLEKQKFTGAKQKRFIKKQERVKGKMERLIKKRKEIYKKYDSK